MLKKYSTVAEIVRDLQKLSRQSKLQANDEIETEDTPGGVEIINIRQGSKKAPTYDLSKISKLTQNSKIGKSLKESTEKLERLMAQQNTVRNMLSALTHDFANSGEPEAEKAIVSATKLLKKTEDSIKTINKELHETTQKAAPPEFINDVKTIASRLRSLLKDKFSNQEIQMTACEGPQYTAFIIMHDVINSVDMVTPQQVFAISWSDNKLWIRPDLDRVLPLGNFVLGKEVANVDKAMIAIKVQLSADGQIGNQSKLPVPLSARQLNLHHIYSAIKSVKVNNDPGSVDLVIDKKLSQIAATKVVNDAIIYIHSRAAEEKNFRAKFQIQRTELVKRSNGWYVKLYFNPGGQYSGKTFEQEQIDALRPFFTDDQIKRMLRVAVQEGDNKSRVDNDISEMRRENPTSLPVNIKKKPEKISEAPKFVTTNPNGIVFAFDKRLDTDQLKALVKKVGGELLKEIRTIKPKNEGLARSRLGKKPDVKPAGAIATVKFKILPDNEVSFRFADIDNQTVVLSQEVKDALSRMY